MKDTKYFFIEKNGNILKEQSEMIDEDPLLKPEVPTTEEPPQEGIDKAKDLLRSFFAHLYRGEWSIKDPLDKKRLHSSFESQNGIMFVSIFCIKF
jgi:hypothetical protein